MVDGRAGSVVILNGAPRAGKSSIARALAAAQPDRWVNHGVDASMATTRADLLPGVGLRPGGERPDLEPHLVDLFAEMYAEVARLARTGANVAVDVGHHDAYTRPLQVREQVGEWLEGLAVLWVGVHCDIDEILRRRAESGDGYLVADPDGVAPAPVRRWQVAVHAAGGYDLEVDTGTASPQACAAQILRALA